MQNQSGTDHKSLGALLVDQQLELAIFHNATLLTDLHRYQRLTGIQEDAYEERVRLVASLMVALNGATSVDAINDFGALKLPEHNEQIKARLAEDDAHEAERQRQLDAWRSPTHHVWKSVFLFGHRFEPLSYRPVPVVELPARDWFDSLHLLPDEGMEITPGVFLTIRLNWSSYFGAIETHDFRHLKAEAAAIGSTKLWQQAEWAKRQTLPLPDFDDESYVVPEIIEHPYAVDPISGAPVCGFGTIAPASYKSDSGENYSWRMRGDDGNAFITHWFKSRDDAEKCRTLSQAIVTSTRAARAKTSQKKQSADNHKQAASKLQAKIRLLVAAMPEGDPRREMTNATIADLEPMLIRSKSAPVIKWTADASPTFNRLVREVTKSAESVTASVDGLFAFAMESIAEGSRQDYALQAIDSFEMLERQGVLRTLADRAERVDEMLTLILKSMSDEFVDDSPQRASKAA